MALPIDTRDLIKTDFTVDFGGLVTLLQDMHKKVTQQGRLLSSLNEEVVSLRASQEEAKTACVERSTQAAHHRDTLADALSGVERALQAVPQRYVAIDDFQAGQREFMVELRDTHQRIDEVENCSGGKVAATVEKHIARHLRSWYAPVRDRELDHLKNELGVLEEKLRRCCQDDLERTDTALRSTVDSNARLAAQELRELDMQKEGQIAAVRKIQSTDKAELTDLVAHNETAAAKRHTALDNATVRRFVEGEGLLHALYYTLNVDEAGCLHLYSTKDMDAMGVGDGDEGDVGGGGGDGGTDRRVALMHATLPFLEMRSKTQQDIRNRVKQSKEEDQDDFSKHVVELQKELKKKTDTPRVMQMLHDNMDKGLYDVVDNLKARLAELETLKVFVPLTTLHTHTHTHTRTHR